jgi:hypothetical protein
VGPQAPDDRVVINRSVRFADEDEATGAADATGCISLRRRWSLEGLTAPRYDDVAMIGDATNVSMSIDNGPSRNFPRYNDFQNKVDSNPVAHRVRRKRQRLPPSLLIENASDQLFSLPSAVPPEAFPIKASDHTATGR